MGKLLFNSDAIVNGKVIFEAGKVYDISNELGSYDRWVKRGATPVEESEDKKEEGSEIKEENEPTLEPKLEGDKEVDAGLDALGGSDEEVVNEEVVNEEVANEEVVNEEVKKENKKDNKKSHKVK